MSNFLNCHMQGVHSLSVGTTEDGKLIRMFIAERHHRLWQNSMTNFAKGVQSLAFHNHKSDITIIPLNGIIYNISLSKRDRAEDNFAFNEFIYHSAIVDSNAGYFSKTGNSLSMGVKRHRVSQPLFLEANTLHTISVPVNTSASWLIIEGDDADDDMDYISYSASDLSNWSSVGLYQEPTVQKVEELKNKYLMGVKI
ncbi:hypothetical protein ACTXKB_03335 [Psychrobacter aquimaris]|uniref:hypothetical protein n=1 Tax=Psychrobacter aquimaris TaxID=292733 RepID=UPI003FD39F1B